MSFPQEDLLGAVDVHAHFLPDGYQAALEEVGLPRPDNSPLPPWSVESHLATMDRLGIVTSVLSLSSPGVAPFGERAPRWANEVNSQASRIVSRYPGRFGFFATLPLPVVEAACGEACRALDQLGASGVALLTHTDGVYLGDPELEPLMQVLDDRSCVVFVHPTSPAACSTVDFGRPAPLLEFLFDTTRAFVNLHLNGVLERFPHIRWIVPHNGALLSGVLDRVDLLGPLVTGRSYGQTFVHAASRFYYEIGSSAPFPRTAAASAALTDPRHLLMGTDLPYAPLAAIERSLDELRSSWPLGPFDRTGLLHANAEALMPRLAGAK